jgi:polysaccharide export outer membrane protein
MTMQCRFLVVLVGGLLLTMPAIEGPAQDSEAGDPGAYAIQPGDRLQVSVWGEPELQLELLVAPDGGIAFPLAGELNVIGKSTVMLREEISTRLARYISEPIVTVTVEEVAGNRVYVLGQVNRPGEFVVNPMVDVLQALSMAGGTTAFASLGNIRILRRQGSGQTAMRFDYDDVVTGRDLASNIMLRSGDVVVVP